MPEAGAATHTGRLPAHVGDACQCAWCERSARMWGDADPMPTQQRLPPNRGSSTKIL